MAVDMILETTYPTTVTNHEDNSSLDWCKRISYLNIISLLSVYQHIADNTDGIEVNCRYDCIADNNVEGASESKFVDDYYYTSWQ